MFRPDGTDSSGYESVKVYLCFGWHCNIVFANDLKLYLKNFEIHGVKIRWNCDFILTLEEYSVHEQINWKVNCGNHTEGLSHYVLT